MKRTKKFDFNLGLIPVLLIFGIVPLITYTYTYPEAIFSGYAWFKQGTFAIDYFLHTKSVWISVIGGVMLFETVFCVFKLNKEDKLKLLKRMWPMAVYFLCVIFSTIFALNKSYAVKGGFDQCEPMLVLMTYSITTLYVMFFVKEEKDFRYILYAIFFCGFVMAIISFLQYKGYNIFTADWMRYFIMNAQQREVLNDVGVANYPYATFGNTNYIGPYVCTVLPIVVTSFFLKSSKKILKILSLVSAASLFFLLIASNSKTGLAIFVAMIFVTLVFRGKEVFKRIYIVAPIIVAGIVLIVLYDRSKDYYYASNTKRFLFPQRREYTLTGIDTTGDYVKVFYKEKELTFAFDTSSQIVSAEAYENGAPLQFGGSGNRTYVILSDGEQLPINVYKNSENDLGMDIHISDRTWDFNYDMLTQNYTYINVHGNKDECIVWDNVLKGYEKLATSRGIIWGTTIPMLRKYILVGAGPDNFPVALGRNGTDYVLKHNLGDIGIIYTRPHNYFLQMGVNTGVLSMIVTIVFFVMYLVDGFKLYFWKKLDSNYKILGFGCMIGVIGFLGCGLANDSLPCSSPIFWCILGLGMAANRMIREKQKEIG